MYTRRLRIIHFDVSQGESTLISLLGPVRDFHVLIDGGRKCRGEYVARCLEQLGVDEIDYAICTHLDNDHHEGLVPVITSNAITVKRLLVPKEGFNKEKFSGLKMACEVASVPYRVAVEGEFLISDEECSLEILHVGTPELRDDNTASIACLLEMNCFTYYTGGDLPCALEEKLDLPDHVCAFKCGHHGAETSTSEDFVEQLKPTVAFISAGRHAHGHPRQEIVKYLCNSSTLQRFYSTNCIHPRQGFRNGRVPSTYEAKGVVCSDRSQGILGHIVLYTDDKLSKQHEGSKVNFFVLRPPANGGGTVWRAYKHVCSNTKHRPQEVLPGGIVHLRQGEYPEFRLVELSPSLQRKRRRMTGSFSFPPFFALDTSTRSEGLRPASPIHNFLKDPINFTVVESKKGDTSTSESAKKKKGVKRQREHADKIKRSSECIGCRAVPDEAECDSVDCIHEKAWLVCSDCSELFADGFDCEAF